MKVGDLVVPVKDVPALYDITNQENECVVEVLIVEDERFKGKIVSAKNQYDIGWEDWLLTKYFVPVKSANFKTLYEKLL